MSQILTTTKASLWKPGNKSNIEFLSSFKRLQQEDPKTYNLIEQIEGYVCQDHSYEYKVGKNQFGLWVSRRRLGLQGLQQIENDNRPPARPSAFTDNLSPSSAPRSHLSAPADTTVIILAITQLVDSINLLTLAQLASSENEKNEIRQKVLSQ